MTLQTSLLQWFEKNQRPLPWRAHYRPYEVWISEIMLQQTQMNTVLPYYERWFKSFPDIGTLAQSDIKAVLKAWEGLGYYSRARNLHETANVIVREHSGKFPDDFEKILGLKGVGRYTAGAIASIAFNQEKPIVDGNVLRVLSRVYAIKEPVDVEKNKPLFWELQEKLIPKGKARWFNQALMELGALVCSTENPACAVCPLRSFCKAYKNGDPENYPVRAKKTKTVKVTAAAVVLENKGRYLIRLRPLGEIMGGLWEFPEWKLSKNKPLPAESVQKKAKKLAAGEFSVPTENMHPLGVIKRNYTYFNESLHVFKVSVTGEAQRRAPGKTWESVWVPKEHFSKYPFSSAHAKIVKLIGRQEP